ncbi:MAG TPA: hypothetical protein PK166_03600 [Candidatus Hydrogenedentes bacterium]|nr:hypothetical protein [Candidatus Hydrogenedentota bacterium]HQH67453.1 hypothetical protein [Candidatus Hydrogenedentota bacterium]
MYWKITVLPGAREASDPERAPAGRFVLQRHYDGTGPHWDLRLEQTGYLVGWRLEHPFPDEGCWALEKGPHPTRWLEQDGDAAREDAGLYTVLAWSKDARELLLEGRKGTRALRAERMPFLSPAAARALQETMDEMAVDAASLPAVLRDGVTARRRAIERFCGLGRELDGGTFDEPVWRRTLESLSLDELTAHLRAYEVRFDHKYPPSPASHPETLPDGGHGAWTDRAMGIVRGG